jgi:glycosyltransferase involved in cell wall biosynthesis
VPTVASNLGAFAEVIDNSVDGFLANTTQEWVDTLENLINNPQLRAEIGETAYNRCRRKCVTGFSGKNVKQIVEQNRAPNAFFMPPGNVQSGGIMVALNHMKILQKTGFDVSTVNPYVRNVPTEKHAYIEFSGTKFPQIDPNEYQIEGRMDKVVATMWPTSLQLEQYVNRGDGYYLVQHFEPGFMAMSDPDYMRALRTYSLTTPVKFVTVSKWIENWLSDDFEVTSELIPNGINLDIYTPSQRDFSDNAKIRILIEGDPDSAHKNVAEAFEITNGLDRDKFEVHFVSYYAKPEWGFKYDKQHIAVPYEQMPEIYRSCDILLKTSVFESFSYPPLEMMATGGYVVCLPNEGNVEYLQDEVNCLFYEQGNLKQARSQIQRIAEDAQLRATLYANGVRTAEQRSWDAITPRVLEVYGVNEVD